MPCEYYLTPLVSKYISASTLYWGSPILFCEFSVWCRWWFKQFRHGQDSSSVDRQLLKGTISFVKRSTIREGRVSMGEEVNIIWENSKKAYNAIVRSVDSVLPAPPTPRWRATMEEEPLTFQLAAEAPRAAAQAKLTSLADQQGIDALADAQLQGLKLACSANFRLWRTNWQLCNEKFWKSAHGTATSTSSCPTYFL